MSFPKGHKFAKGGARLGSGPKKKIKTQYDDWIKDNPQKVATLLDILYQKGLNGDKDAAVYVIDRILGRPRQEIDQRVLQANIAITPDMRALAARELLEAKTIEAELLTEGGDDGQERANQIEGQALQGEE